MKDNEYNGYKFLRYTYTDGRHFYYMFELEKIYLGHYYVVPGSCYECAFDRDVYERSNWKQLGIARFEIKNCVESYIFTSEVKRIIDSLPTA